MTTKRLPFQASTLCAGGTLLVLGGFLALNLAGCGGGNSTGPIGQPTAVPGTTATPSPATLQFRLQLTDGSAASGGTVTLTSSTGRTYSGTANNGVVNIGKVVPGLYTLVFTVTGPNGQTISTTRSITITSSTAGAQTFSLRQGDTGTSNPFTISGRILLNPAGTNDPDGDQATANCTAVVTPITDAVVITVRDLNSTNGTPIIAQITRPAQASTVPGPQRGNYSITIPYQPRSFRVTVTNANDAPFAGVSASTSFPTSSTVVNNVDICTNASTVAPQPSVTATPSPTPFVAPTTVGTPVATSTSTPVPNPTAVPTIAPTSTTAPPATNVPVNTPLPGTTTVPTTPVTVPTTTVITTLTRRR